MTETGKLYIKEEDNLHQEWYEHAKKVNELQSLDVLITHILNDYELDYGTAVHAIAAAAVRAAQLMADKLEITHFQASLAMWMFILEWMYPNAKTEIRLLKFDDMLYPQYEYKFENTISMSRSFQSV